MTPARLISLLTLAAYTAAILVSSGALVICRGVDGHSQIEFAGSDYECCAPRPTKAPSCCDHDAGHDELAVAAAKGCSDTPLSVISADQTAGRHATDVDGLALAWAASLLPQSVAFMTETLHVAGQPPLTIACSTGPPPQALVLLC